MEECTEEIIFTDNYAKLSQVLNVNTLIPHFITNRIITVTDASDIRSCNRESEKLLEYIARHLKAGYTYSFYLMLHVMKTHGTITAETLAEDIISSLDAKSCKGIAMYMVLWLCVFCFV